MDKYDYINAKKWLCRVLGGIDTAIQMNNPSLLKGIGKRDAIIQSISDLSRYIINNGLQSEVGDITDIAYNLERRLIDDFRLGYEDCKMDLERHITLKMVFAQINEWGVPSQQPKQLQQQPKQPNQQPKQLGRKVKSVKDLVLVGDKESYITRLREQMKGASNDKAMYILINAIRNKYILKPSHKAFAEAFPGVIIPESTYYYRLRKARLD